MRFCRSQFLLPEENIDFFEYPILFYHIREIFQTKTAGKQKSSPCEQPDSPVRESAHSFPCCPFPEKPSGTLLFPEKLSAPVLFPEKRGISPFFPVFSCPFPTGGAFLSCFPPVKLHFSRFQKCTLNRNSPFSPLPVPSAFSRKSTLSARRGHTRTAFSPLSFLFLFFSPLSGVTAFSSLHAVLSRKDLSLPVNYFFTISTASVSGAPPEKPRIFLLFRPVFFCPFDLFTVIHIFLCISPADSGRISPISAVFPRL